MKDFEKLTKEQKLQFIRDQNNWREIGTDEIVIEVDTGNTEKEMEQARLKLLEENYNFKIYKAEGQRSPHLHLVVEGLDDLEKNDRQLYKELFIKKYCPLGDLSLAQDKHNIAEENKEHYKYKTIKKLIFNSSRGPGHWNYIEPGILLEMREIKKDPKKQRKTKVDVKDIKLGNFTETKSYKLAQEIKITDLARQYGLLVDGPKALCPFHADRIPSLNMDDATGIFHCFGCHASGGIVKFERMLIEKGLVRTSASNVVTQSETGTASEKQENEKGEQR